MSSFFGLCFLFGRSFSLFGRDFVLCFFFRLLYRFICRILAGGRTAFVCYANVVLCVLADFVVIVLLWLVILWLFVLLIAFFQEFNEQDDKEDDESKTDDATDDDTRDRSACEFILDDVWREVIRLK